MFTRYIHEPLILFITPTAFIRLAYGLIFPPPDSLVDFNDEGNIMRSVMKRVVSIGAGLALTSGVMLGATAASAGELPVNGPQQLMAKLATKASQGESRCEVVINKVRVIAGCTSAEFDSFYVVAQDVDGNLQKSSPIIYQGSAGTVLTFKRPVAYAQILDVQPDYQPGKIRTRQG
ncbi:hypothetical protein [Amycolatopsis sp. NPDC051071]|uniref:hypothetical protein n=1 Tax=Amycolatopsis sp. NPDC051071 TaxID=3154637 RepID=UPI003413AE7B